MSKVKGLLEKAYQGNKGFWSINVNDTWYGTYDQDYTKYEGMEVEFEASKRGKYWNAKDVKPVKGAAKPAAKAGAGNTQAAQDRQQSIVLQSSYKTAAEFVGAMVAAGHVVLGQTKNKQFDIALGLLDETAKHIYFNCIDPSEFLDDGEDPAPGPAEDDEDWEHEDA